MAEILTESFCERCGTRYTFEAAIPKKHRIGKLKVLSKGLKNYVLSEDSSLDEALADARSEEERELSGGQLDAFHQTFQFCMSCRQYTCANCWNEAEGRCLSCAPLSLTGNILGSPLDDLLARGGIAPLVSPASAEAEPASGPNGTTNGYHAAEEPATAAGSAWPTIDLFRSPEALTEAAPAAPEAVAEADLIADAVTPEAPVDSPPAPTELSEPSDFWSQPFTGFLPVAEPTNGHDPAGIAAEAEAGPAQPEATAEPAALVEEAAPFEPSVAESTSVDEAAAAPIEEAVEPVQAAAAPLEAPTAIEATAPAAEAPEPVAAVEDAGSAAEAVEAPEAAAAAASVDPEAEARATELAERTTRLLGRFRVQPRSAGSAPSSTPGVESSEAPAAACSKVVERPTRPAWMRPAAPASAPEPVAATPPPPPVETPPEPVELETVAAEPVAVVAPEPEPEVIAAPIEPAPEPVEVLAAEPEPEIAPEPEPDVAPEPEPESAPLAAAPAPALTDRVEMPAWPRLVRPPLSDSPPVQAPPAPMPAQAPQWPAPLRPGYDASSTPFWASGEKTRVAGEIDVWTASAREVAEAPGQVAGVQSCLKCGLSLSATARFCRRCGSRQG